MRVPPRVLLVVEDNAGDARLLREMLSGEGGKTRMVHVMRMEDAETYLKDSPVDIILLDLGLDDAKGLEAVRRARSAAPRTPLLVLTGLDDETIAAEALQQGAQDYLVKGQIETRGLLRALRNAVERKAMEAALFVEKERAQVTLNCIADAVASMNLAGELTFINQAAEALTGWTLAEALGRHVSDVVRIIDGSSRRQVSNFSEEEDVFPMSPNSSTRMLVRRDGSEIPVEDSAAPINDSAGNKQGSVIVFRDVSAARAMSEQLAHTARHDFLTGLPNRMLLSDRIGQAIAIAGRHRKRVAVLFLDLDGFKHINDTLGHALGDKLLQSVSKRLVGCVRGSDTVSRQGGDEFVVLLSEVDRAEDAAILARRMLEAVAASHFIDQHELNVTTSIGVSIYPDDGADAAALVKAADTAMYQSKANGRQTYQFFLPAMNAQAVEQHSIEESLRHALARSELTLEYQPKVNLYSGKIAGAEALVRWNHPTRGPLMPAQFMPVAETCGLIQPIGEWVMREACRQSSAWAAAGLNLPIVAVNVSASEFRSEGFVERVWSVLKETGLDPSGLELELTESVLMKHNSATVSTLDSLRSRGVRLAVDDFGTGYSSLNYLRKYPIDALKIDQSFIRQIGAGEDTSVVTAILSMARGLKLSVVAEGVETQRELAFLQSHRCDEAQGFHFSRPLPAREFGRLLQSGIVPAMAARLTETQGQGLISLAS